MQHYREAPMRLSMQDEREIIQVLLAYSTGIDSRDWSLFRSCFDDDIITEYGAGIGWSSGDAITEFMRDVHEEYAGTLHRITNMVIQSAEGGARIRSYVDALLVKPDNTVMQADGYYDDLLINTGNGWKIKRRRFTLVRLQGELPSKVSASRQVQRC